MNEELEQVLIAPKGTRFTFIEGHDKAHLGTQFSLRSFCNTVLTVTQVKMITCYEREICSECLTAYRQLNPITDVVKK